MNIHDILKKVDHTLLKPDATFDDIKLLIDDAARFNTASVCIAPCFVKAAAQYSEGRVPICTVIGFPNGYNTKESKCFEAKDAVQNGAAEVDMVINIGLVKAEKYDEIKDEINAVKKAAEPAVLKVIIETCLLTQEEKIKMCQVVSESEADFIKTSTGFSSGGATKEDIALFAEHVSNNTKIKAAGGISSLKDAEAFIALGADRLGTSRIVKIAKEELI